MAGGCNSLTTPCQASIGSSCSCSFGIAASNFTMYIDFEVRSITLTLPMKAFARGSVVARTFDFHFWVTTTPARRVHEVLYPHGTLSLSVVYVVHGRQKKTSQTVEGPRLLTARYRTDRLSFVCVLFGRGCPRRCLYTRHAFERSHLVIADVCRDRLCVA